MASVDKLSPAIRDLYPGEIRGLYEIHEWRNATVVFKKLHPQEWEELMTVLGSFRLRKSEPKRIWSSERRG